VCVHYVGSVLPLHTVICPVCILYVSYICPVCVLPVAPAVCSIRSFPLTQSSAMLCYFFMMPQHSFTTLQNLVYKYRLALSVSSFLWGLLPRVEYNVHRLLIINVCSECLIVIASRLFLQCVPCKNVVCKIMLR